jgi:mRNA interferase RelE/StbE
MRIEYTNTFLKEIKSLDSSIIKESVEKAILNCKEAINIKDIKHLKKLKGFSNYYRIGIHSYRIGLFIEDDLVIFSRCLPRKDIYKYFP